MPGIPTQIVVADLVFDGAPGAIAEADRPFFNLGAISLAMTDFLPARPEATSGNAPLFDIWRPIMVAIADTPATPTTPAAPGILTNLASVRGTLDRARKIVEDAKANFITSLEAKAQLLGMMDEISGLSALSTTLTGQVAALSGLPGAIMGSVATLRPRPKSPPTQDWRARELLHGSRTGKFFEILRRRAGESGDSRLTAFVSGVAVAYGGALAGIPFRNGVVGGPIRNHFWRGRTIGHRIDAWVWGYYRTQAELARSGGDIIFASSNTTPDPGLGGWINVCGANVQERFAFGGISGPALLNSVAAGTPVPAFLPAAVVDLWTASLAEAHPDGVAAGIDAAGLQSAYALTWLTTWMQTSPEFLRAIPPKQINWPDGCGDIPRWAQPDGSVVVGGATINPPQPALGDPSVPKLASAIAAALFALINFLAGNIVAGIEALTAALAFLDAGTPPNWDQMGCDLAWSDGFIISLENAFRALLVAAGVAPPYTEELVHSAALFAATSAVTPNDPAIIPADAALSACASPHRHEIDPITNENLYPRDEWQIGTPAASNWTQYPTEPMEPPHTTSWPPNLRWPNTFVDGLTVASDGATPPTFTRSLANGVETNPFTGTPTILDPDEWELRMMRAEAGGNPGFVPFGNAVSLARVIIGAQQGSLPDWDLDSDRGVGWPTWFWPGAGTSGPVRRA